jgi:hypothetical protein
VSVVGGTVLGFPVGAATVWPPPNGSVPPILCSGESTFGTLPAAAKAVRASAMEENRSSGFLASMRQTTCSVSAVTCGANWRSDGGGSCRCMLKSSPKPSLMKGGRPASISNRITPRE